MNNLIVFGPVQSGKSTLMGYIASSYLSDRLFADEAYEIDKRIRKLGISDVKKELILPGFLSLDKDELVDMSNLDPNGIGTTKRVHRKRIHFESNKSIFSKDLTFIDTPGIRDHRGDQYGCMFEGNIGLYVVSAIDVQRYLSLRSDNKKKLSIEKRKMFAALQFWGDYKGADKLIIALTKTDMLSEDPEGMKTIYDAFSEITKRITGVDVPIIPTSVQLSVEDGIFKREERNIIHADKNLLWYHGPTLISVLMEKINDQNTTQRREFRLAAVRHIRKIPNSSSVALRIQCVCGDIDTSKKLILGPVRDRRKEFVFLQGTVKSLKIEDGALSDRIPEGMIGGVAFKTLSRYGSKNARVDLQDYKLTATTALLTGKMKTGNILTVRIKEDEIGGQSIQALSQLKPKAQVRFYWLGKAVIGDLIEFFRNEGYLYLSLANLADIVNGKASAFALPDCDNLLDLALETLAEIRYSKYNLSTDRIDSLQTHLLFRVVDIKNIDSESRYLIEFSPANYFSVFQEIQGFFSEHKKIRLDDEKKALLIDDVRMNSLPDYYRLIRQLSTYAGIYSYTLKFIIRE